MSATDFPRPFSVVEAECRCDDCGEELHRCNDCARRTCGECEGKRYSSDGAEDGGAVWVCGDCVPVDEVNEARQWGMRRAFKLNVEVSP